MTYHLMNKGGLHTYFGVVLAILDGGGALLPFRTTLECVFGALLLSVVWRDFSAAFKANSKACQSASDTISVP